MRSCARHGLGYFRMKTFFRALSLSAVLVVLSCSGPGLSKGQLKALEQRAESGDVEAACQLADYYYRTVKYPISPEKRKQLSGAENLTPREAKKLEKCREIDANYEKWSQLAAKLSNTELDDVPIIAP